MELPRVLLLKDMDGTFSLETSDFDRTLIKQQNRNQISRVSFRSQRGQTEIEHRIY